MMIFNSSSWFLLLVVVIGSAALSSSTVSAFTSSSPASGMRVRPTTPTGTSDYRRSSSLAASSMGGGDGKQNELFKAGLLANLEDEAAALASQKIRSVQDLGWSSKVPAKRRGNTRPRHWAFGGAGEKAVQDKPNYDPENPLCVEKWLSLQDFYGLVKDDTAVADTIFVALAKGGAYVEREVAEQVLARWRPAKTSTTATTSAGTGGAGIFGRKAGGGGRSAAAFDKQAFLKTVQEGRQDFLVGWAAFFTITGVAVAGIVFPTNPLQLALVDLLESVMGADVRIPE